MTPAERDEVRVIAEAVGRGCYGFDDFEARRWLQVLARAASRYVPPGDASDPAVTSVPSQAWGRAISVAACKRVPPREAQAIAHAIHAAADAAEETDR